MTKLRVFPDTGALVAMVVFPQDRDGQLSSNDFQTFHSSQAKAFWNQHDIEVESLYGLLCVFGLRERNKRIGAVKGGIQMNSDNPTATILSELDETRLDEMAASLEAFQKTVSRLDELDLQDVEPAVTFSVPESDE